MQVFYYMRGISMQKMSQSYHSPKFQLYVLTKSIYTKSLTLLETDGLKTTIILEEINK